MFATSFVIEEAYATIADLPTLAVRWVQIVGVLSMGVLLIWEVFRLIRGVGSSLYNGLSGRLRGLPEDQAWRIRSYRLFLVLSALGLAVMAGAIGFGAAQGDRAAYLAVAMYAFNVACACAVLAVSWEFLLDLSRFSPRRIWAIGLFSIREALRRKVLWSFCLILIIFLFASWFIKADRPENQWRIYVDMVFFVMGALILVTAGVLACFSLPTDIRQQTIHTVVTKPVEKFEVIFGRIVGITVLMTAILAVVSHLSLLYVFRGIDAASRGEVMRARVRYGGSLSFEEMNLNSQWVPRTQRFSVGREWEYRQYIRGGAMMEAVWRFRNPPTELKSKERVPLEFGFDIFRTSKGGDQYKEGVDAEFTFVNTAKWNAAAADKFREAVDPETRQPLTDMEKARRFGYYKLPSPPTIVDYTTYRVTFPGAILEDLGGGELEVRVNCTSPNQYLGMAEPDLYILADEGNFYGNFLKGTAGIWFIMEIAVCLAVVFSSYLSALVDLFLTSLLMVCGIPRIRHFVERLTTADMETNPGGGPGEAILRIFSRKALTAPLEQTRGLWVIERIDDLSRFVFKGFVSILPDLHHYDRTMFVAEGFQIPNSYMLVSLVLLVGYVFPFLLAGYYLLSAREVAGAV